MSVVRWDPWAEVGDLQRAVARTLGAQSGSGPRVPGFPVDVYETPQELVVRADLPGVRPEDIRVEHHDGEVFIQTTRRVDAPDGATWLFRQTAGGEVARAFALGVPVDFAAARATYDAGVLELRLPKAEEARPKAIPVRAARGAGAAEPAPAAIPVPGA